MHPSVALGLLSTLLFGLRHGIDYDHIAAITDITSTQPTRRESMKLGLLYAAGHGVIVFTLGSIAVMLGTLLPTSIDGVMERVVGVTLIMLGVYVLWTLFTVPREEFRLVGRYQLLLRAGTSIWRRLFGRAKREHSNLTMPRSAFLIGMVHGVGAETPTQLGLFLFAAGVGGRWMGFAGVSLFVTGVMITNVIMSAFAAEIFLRSAGRTAIYRGMAGLTAAYSLIVGFVFLFGISGLLPAL